MKIRRILALVVSLAIIGTCIPLRPVLSTPQPYYVTLTIEKVGLIDPIESPWLLEDGADWTVKVLFYDGVVWDETTIEGPHNNDFPYLQAQVTWQVDLSVFQNVTFEIQLWERDGWGLLPPDIADISSCAGGGYDDYNGTLPRGAMYVGYYNLVNNSLIGDYAQYLGNTVYGNYYRTSGNFDGSTSIDENDADLWFYIRDDYGGYTTRIVGVGEQYSTIQAAINDAIPGANETVRVMPGTYHERITINKTNIMVMGVTGAVIDGSSGGGGEGNLNNVVFIENDYVWFTGFQVLGAGVNGIGVIGNFSTVTGNSIRESNFGAYAGAAHSFFCWNTIVDNSDGFYALRCYNNTIAGNVISNNSGYGVYISGSCLIQGGVPNLVEGNTLANNSLGGLQVEFSDNNYIQGNHIHDNTRGISLIYSGKNILRTNTIERNDYNFGIQAYDSLQHYLQDVDNTNDVDGKHIYFWVNKTSGQVPDDAGYVAVVNSNNVNLDNLELRKNLNGILLAFSTNTAIHNVSLVENREGISMFYSNGTTVHHNNFINSTVRHVSMTNSFNTSWDDDYPSGGNYWSPCTGIDLYNGPDQNIAGSDGIYDSPWTIATNNTDRYPRLAMYPSHDVAILNVVPNSTVVELGESISCNVTLINQGDFPETFNIALRANETFATMNSITNLQLRQSNTYSLTWNSTGCPTGNYTISAFADPVQSETDLEDNLCTDGTLTIADLTSPSIMIFSPENRTYDADPVPLTFAVNEITSWMGYSLDGLANVTVSGNTTLTSLQNGFHSLIVYANDTAGNMGASEIVYFTANMTHDGAIVSFVTCKDDCTPMPSISLGYTTHVIVTVLNRGTCAESFNVTVYANATIIGAYNVINLQAGDQETLIFFWNTSGYAIDKYTLSAQASIVLGETETGDNTYVDGWVKVTIVGDINGDDKVDMLDVGPTARGFLATPGIPFWNPNADIDDSHKIDMIDIGTVARHFGEHYP